MARLFLFATVLRTAGATVADIEHISAHTDFDKFMAQHKRSFSPGSSEYKKRREIFHKSVARVDAHNKEPGRLWTAGLNHLSDRTEEELADLKGWRHSGQRSSRAASGSALELDAGDSKTKLPDKMDWRNLSMASTIYNQGACGSCWAVATVTVLEAHYEITNRRTRSFSAQELVNCVENKKHCGGKGGCDGATVELGMQYVLNSGLKTGEETPYQGSQGKCKVDIMQVNSEYSGEVGPDGRLLPDPDVDFEVFANVNEDMRSLGLTGFSTLQSNAETPLVQALVNKGPVAISVAANTWHDYEQGLFNKCSQNDDKTEDDWVVNHAVVLFGYGKLGTDQYWLIRNSWGDSWGEKGYIRMLRTGNEGSQCGTDHKPKEGVACDGAPPSVKVCGTCGVLYDSVIPYFQIGSSGSKQQEPSNFNHKGRRKDENDDESRDPTGDMNRGRKKGTYSESEEEDDRLSNGDADSSESNANEHTVVHETDDNQEPVLLEAGDASVGVEADASLSDLQRSGRLDAETEGDELQGKMLRRHPAM